MYLTILHQREVGVEVVYIQVLHTIPHILHTQIAHTSAMYIWH